MEQFGLTATFISKPIKDVLAALLHPLRVKPLTSTISREGREGITYSNKDFTMHSMARIAE